MDNEKLKKSKPGETAEESNNQTHKAGLYRHPETKAEVVTFADPLYGEAQSEGIVRAGFVRVGDAPKRFLKKNRFTAGGEPTAVKRQYTAEELKELGVVVPQAVTQPVDQSERKNPQVGAEAPKQDASDKVVKELSDNQGKLEADKEARRTAVEATKEEQKANEDEQTQTEERVEERTQTADESSKDGGDESQGDGESTETQLNDLGREELNAKAAELGVGGAENLPNKEAVVSAIEAKQNTNSNEKESE